MSAEFKTRQAKAIYDGCLMALDDIWEEISLFFSLIFLQVFGLS
jgi:hypothetical protein